MNHGNPAGGGIGPPRFQREAVNTGVITLSLLLVTNGAVHRLEELIIVRMFGRHIRVAIAQVLVAWAEARSFA